MKTRTQNSSKRDRGKSINGDNLLVETRSAELIEGKRGKVTDRVTRIKISYTKYQIFKYLAINLMLAVTISTPLYLLLNLTVYWHTAYAVGAVYMLAVLTTTVVSEEVIVVHGKVIQTVVRYMSWPSSYTVYLCEHIDIVCINEGFRRQRFIFYLMLVTKKEYKVLFENTLPNLEILQVILMELRGAIGDSRE